MTVRERLRPALGRLRHLDEEFFVWLSRRMTTAEDLPKKRADQLRVGDWTRMGIVTRLEPGDGDWPAEKPEIWVTCELDDQSEPLVVPMEVDDQVVLGPETTFERIYDLWDRTSSVIYQRRRSGRVSYHIGPFSIYCWRRPLEVKFGWSGFSRFRRW